MNQSVKALSLALDDLRTRLTQSARTTPGFGEMRLLYLSLTSALIAAGDKADGELAAEMHKVSAEVAEEWESNKQLLQSWRNVLEPVVKGVGAVLSAGRLANPLDVLL